MQKTTPSTTSLVYAAVISNPGVTSRALKVLLPNCPATAINGALQSLHTRGAIHMDAVPGGRNAKYSKGKAPVVLRAAGTTDNTAADIMKQELKAELVQGLQILQQLMVKLEKI